MARRRAIYVESVIRANLDDLWLATQDPGSHQRWDLRFTQIDYLPATGQAGQAGQQRFRYAVRLGPGVTVSGVGVCAGERVRPDGTRTSALRFGSSDRMSLIRSGSGYWRYVPTARGIRFITGYDYLPGWGRLGWPADRLFRPIMGWATAWSFDRLRLWLENGVPPERSLRRCVLTAGLRIILCVCAWWLRPAAAAGLLMAGIALTRPLPGVPSALRCRRHPPDRSAATPPSILVHLEQL